MDRALNVRTRAPSARAGRLRFALVSALVVLVLSSSVGAVALAAPVAASGPANPEWAYGARWSGSGAGSTANGTYTYDASFGWEVVLSQQNLTPSTFRVVVDWLASAQMHVVFCSPNCKSPVEILNLTDRSTQSINASSDFTTAGLVYAAGVAVPGTAVLNSSSRAQGSLVETLTAQVGAPAVARTGDRTLQVETSSDSSEAFAGGLGLLPENLSTTPSWNSTATYEASAPWSVQSSLTGQGLNGSSVDRQVYSNGSVTRNGTASLTGSASGSLRLADKIDTPIVALSLNAPFSLFDGVALIPQSVDLFHGSGNSWQSLRVGSQEASVMGFDYSTAPVGHWGMLASAIRYDDSSNAGVSSLSPSDAGVIPALTPQYSGSELIQGEPQTLPAAQQNLNCLSGGACPNTSASPIIPLFGLVGIGAILVIGLLTVGLVVQRRRQITPPASAHVYAAVDGSGRSSPLPTPEVAPVPSKGPPTAEPEPDDPLGHLW